MNLGPHLEIHSEEGLGMKLAICLAAELVGMAPAVHLVIHSVGVQLAVYPEVRVWVQSVASCSGAAASVASA